MTGSSPDVRSESANPSPGPAAAGPSTGANGSSKPTSTSWLIVLALLLGFPFLFSLIGSRWLGTPEERLSPDQVFAQLTVDPVATRTLESLAYGNLLFVRLQLPQESRTDLLRSLQAFKATRGAAEKPISLPLERPWWTPPKAEQGTFWKRAAVTVWNPDNQPETFYAVVDRSR